MSADIADTIRSGIAEILAIEVEDVEPGAFLVDDLGLDSLALMEIVLSLRQTFGGSVHEGDVKSLLVALDQYLPEAARTPIGAEVDPGSVTNQLQVETLVAFVRERVPQPTT